MKKRRKDIYNERTFEEKVSIKFLLPFPIYFLSILAESMSKKKNIDIFTKNQNTTLYPPYPSSQIVLKFQVNHVYI